MGEHKEWNNEIIIIINQNNNVRPSNSSFEDPKLMAFQLMICLELLVHQQFLSPCLGLDSPKLVQEVIPLCPQFLPPAFFR